MMNNMTMLDVVVIDGGVQRDVIESLSGQAKDIRSLQLIDRCCFEQYAHPLDKISHGTICTALLIEYMAKYRLLDLVNITSLSIVDLNNEKTIATLIDALNWCADQRVNLVLMSIGVKSYFYANGLLPAIERAKSHSIMVAAASNDSLITYPACFKDVIGVKYNPNTPIETLDVIECPYDGIDIEAHISDAHTLTNAEKLYSVVYAKSNSIIVPFVAAHLSKVMLLNGHATKNELLKMLSTGSQAKRKPQVDGLMGSDIPVVLSFYNVEYKREMVKILCSLVRKFMSDEYSCACITDACCESVFEESIYCLPIVDSKMRSEWIEYYRKALAFNSFLLVMIEKNTFQVNDFQVDIVVPAHDCNMRNTEDRVEEIYAAIIMNMALDDGAWR